MYQFSLEKVKKLFTFVIERELEHLDNATNPIEYLVNKLMK